MTARAQLAAEVGSTEPLTLTAMRAIRAGAKRIREIRLLHLADAALRELALPTEQTMPETITEQIDREREAFGHWAESVRAQHSPSIEQYNFARDAWIERARREREAAAKASGLARRISDRTGECVLPEHA